MRIKLIFLKSSELKLYIGVLVVQTLGYSNDIGVDRTKKALTLKRFEKTDNCFA